MVICLGRPSPVASSSLPAATARIPEGTGRGAVWVTPRRLFGLAPTGGYRAAPVTGSAVGSYPTLSPLPVVRLRARRAVCFLLPCPSPFGAQALPGSLPDGARTFLECRSTRDHHVRPESNITAEWRKRGKHSGGIRNGKTRSGRTGCASAVGSSAPGYSTVVLLRSAFPLLAVQLRSCSCASFCCASCTNTCRSGSAWLHWASASLYCSRASSGRPSFS